MLKLIWSNVVGDATFCAMFCCPFSELNRSAGMLSAKSISPFLRAATMASALSNSRKISVWMCGLPFQ